MTSRSRRHSPSSVSWGETHARIRPLNNCVASEVHFFTSFPERKATSIFTELNTEKTANMSDR